MKITVLHGQTHHGSTWNITQLFLSQFPDAEITEFTFPTAMPHFCTGCFSCILRSETLCPHSAQMAPIVAALDACDLMVFESPCYVFDMTAQLKAFFDHMGYRWMLHRPNASMFRKAAVIFTTAAGGGTKSVLRQIKVSLSYWGVGLILGYGVNVAASSWANVKPEQKEKIAADLKRMALKYQRKAGHIHPSLPVRAKFILMRSLHKKGILAPVDQAYWKKNGWLDGKCPWNT